MITIELITAALYSLMGLAAFVVVLTQIFKDWASKSSWYQKAKANDKKWPDHLLSFIASFISTGVVLALGIFMNVGIFAGFCVACFTSWLMIAGVVIGCTGFANGLWSYEFMQKILEWIKLLPTPTVNKKKSNVLEHNCKEDEM